MARNHPTSRQANNTKNGISEEDSDSSSTESDYSLPPDPVLGIPIMNHAFMLPTAEKNRNTDMCEFL